MTHRLRAAAALTLLAAACTATPPPATPSPSTRPTYQCTGSTQTATPFPCDQTRYDQQQATKALEDEAKAVYERYWKEYMRLTAAGGASDATDELKAAVAEPLLKDLVALLRYQYEQKILPVGELRQSLTVAVSHTDTLEESIVTIVGCEDTRATQFRGPTHPESSGTLTVETRFFKRIDGQLKMFNGRSELVTAC